MTWLWQPLLPGAAQLLASAGGSTTEVRTISVAGAATPTLIAERILEAALASAGVAAPSPVAEQFQEVTFAISGSASASFLNATEGQEVETPAETPNGISGGTWKKPKKKKRKRALEYDDGGFGGVLAPMEEGGAVAPVPASVNAAEIGPAISAKPAAIELGPVATLADRLGNIDYAAERAARAKRLEEIEDEDFLLLMAA